MGTEKEGDVVGQANKGAGERNKTEETGAAVQR